MHFVSNDLHYCAGYSVNKRGLPTKKNQLQDTGGFDVGHSGELLFQHHHFLCEDVVSGGKLVEVNSGYHLLSALIIAVPCDRSVINLRSKTEN